MPNRDLKESNRRSPSLQLLSDSAERLWYRLITAVDDFGRLEADPEVVFTTCFQRVPKGWTVQKVRQCLFELASKSPSLDTPLITIYQVGSRQFLEIVSAKQHIYRRAKESKYPSYKNQQVITDIPHLRTDARKCEQIPSNPDLRIPISRIPNPDPRTPEADAASRFEEFWQIYPARGGKKVEKAATIAIFVTLSDEDQILAVQAARNYANSLAVQGISAKDPKRFIRSGKGCEFWRDWITPASLTVNGTAQKCKSMKDGHCESYAIVGSNFCQPHKDFYSMISERKLS